MKTAPLASLALPDGFHDGDWVESKDQDPDGSIRLLQLADVGDGHFRDRSDRRVNEETFERLKCSPVRQGDILVARMPDPLGRACIVPAGLGPAITVVDVAVLRCDPALADRRYVAYAINSQPTRGQIESLQDGATRQRIPRKVLGRIRIPLPDLRQQRTLADYLDRETSQIDTLVDEQQHLIELLRERRDAAWEKSLSLDAPNLPLRRVLESIVDGPFGSALTSSHYADSGVRVIRLGNIGLLEFKAADEAYISEEYAEALSQHAAQAGDVVIAGLGDEKMPLGRATVVPPSLGPAIVKADCYRARPNRLVDPKYLAAALSAPQTRRQIALLARGSTRARLNTKVVRQITIPVPTLEDQRSIVASLEATMEKIDQLIAEADRLVSLAQERRSALITSAVTGRIDVGAAA